MRSHARHSRSTRRPHLPTAAATLTLFLTTACAAPALPGVAAVPAPLPVPAAPSSAVASAVDSSRVHDGWEFLGAPRLDSLVARAWQRHPTMAAASAALRQADELAAARRGASQWPQVDGLLGAQRQRFNPAVLGQSTPPREFTLMSASVNVRYTFDLFGGDRAAARALRHRADVRRHELDGARAQLGAALANAAVNQAWQGAILDTYARLELLENTRLSLVQQQQALGAASRDAVAAQERATEDARVAHARQAMVLAEAQHLLQLLAGVAPGAPSERAFTLADFAPQLRTVDSIPSLLILGRPDVRAADALMRAAHADYASVVARAYPQLQLSASTATQALASGSLFGPGTAVYSLLSQLSQPLLRRGQGAERRAALAGFEGAFAQYEYVVLDSWRSVRDLLAAQEQHALAIAALTRRDESARAALDRLHRQVELGGASRWQLLSAQQVSDAARLALFQEQLRQLSDRIAWYQAVPGAYAAGF